MNKSDESLSNDIKINKQQQQKKQPRLLVSATSELQLNLMKDQKSELLFSISILYVAQQSLSTCSS
jgi:hypothetical protein